MFRLLHGLGLRLELQLMEPEPVSVEIIGARWMLPLPAAQAILIEQRRAGAERDELAAKVAELEAEILKARIVAVGQAEILAAELAQERARADAATSRADDASRAAAALKRAILANLAPGLAVEGAATDEAVEAVLTIAGEAARERRLITTAWRPATGRA